MTVARPTLLVGPRPREVIGAVRRKRSSTPRSKKAATNEFDQWFDGLQNLLAAGATPAVTSVLLETLLGGLGALIVLLFVFASFLALLPLLIAGVSILTTFMLVLVLTTFTDVSIIVQFLIALIGLGVAIDYSLLLVSRWREERAHGRSNEDAVVAAMKTAGHAVFASGVTVAISLLALLIVPVPALRSMGIGGMLIPLVRRGAVLTLLPAPARASARASTTRGSARRHSLTRLVGVGSRSSSGTAGSPPGRPSCYSPSPSSRSSGLQTGQASLDSLASNGVHDTLLSLPANGVRRRPDADQPAGTGRRRGFGRERGRAVDGVRMAVVTPPGKGGVADVVVVPDHETVDNTSVAVVTAVRNATKDRPGYDGIAGLGATVQDYQRAVYDNFPYVLALIALITFVLLVRTFRSVLLPLKAVLLNLISLAAVFGIVMFFWQDGTMARTRSSNCHRPGAMYLLAAGGDLRVPVRAVDGLRGLHPGPDARGVRPHRSDLRWP